MSDDGEEFYKKRASWLQDMWDAEREELNACRKRSNEYFLEYCKERDALRAENKKLRAALDCFLEQATPTQWRYSRERAEKLAKGILAAAAYEETGDE